MTVTLTRFRTRRARVGARLYTPRPMAPREAPRPPRGRRRTKLARELTAARLRAGLTQEQLGERLGVAADTIVRWETGATTPKGLHARVLAAFLAESRPTSE